MEKRYNACGGSFLKFKINMQSKSENHKHVHIIFRMKNANIKLGYIYRPVCPILRRKASRIFFKIIFVIHLHVTILSPSIFH